MDLDFTQTPKFEVGQTIVNLDNIQGIVIAIINPFDKNRRTYWCQMIPNAQPDYFHVKALSIVDTGIETYMLNSYKEQELSESEFIPGPGSMYISDNDEDWL